MAAKRMHEGEVDIDGELVRRLIATQFPHWADLPVEEVDSTGTVNVIYRLGSGLCVRLPRLQAWAGALTTELRWLPRLAPQLPLTVPEPVAAGRPAVGYPFRWAIYRWLDGEPYAADGVADAGRAAVDLAQFIAALRRADAAGAPRSPRDKPLRTGDTDTRAVIESLRGAIDSDAATAVWEASLRAPAWRGRPVWTHGDLLPSNLLVRDGRLSAVLDFGSVGVGDPAIDIIAAWSVFSAQARLEFRRALDVDDATWDRARGLALQQALFIIPYYPESNPAFVDLAQHTVDQLLADRDR